MSYVSGHGGFLTIAGTPNVIVHNSQWTLTTEATIDDVTDSSSGGSAAGLPILTKVSSLEIEIIEDDQAYTDTLGLTEGTQLVVWCKRGAAAKYDRIDGTIVRSVRVTNDQTRARRVTVTCEYGVLTRDTGAPA